jgi:hypothetical protein
VSRKKSADISDQKAARPAEVVPAVRFDGPAKGCAPPRPQTCHPASIGFTPRVLQLALKLNF